MKSDQGFFEYIVSDVFSGIPGIKSRSMFGGWGFYKDGVFFALISEGKLYFKVGEGNIKDYQDAGSKPFVYEMKNGKHTTMSYWEVPEGILENKLKLNIWIEKAVQEKIKSKRKNS
jgi:DNA transformation protein and related proteins